MTKNVLSISAMDGNSLIRTMIRVYPPITGRRLLKEIICVQIRKKDLYLYDQIINSNLYDEVKDYLKNNGFTMNKRDAHVTISCTLGTFITYRDIISKTDAAVRRGVL